MSGGSRNSRASDDRSSEHGNQQASEAAQPTSSAPEAQRQPFIGPVRPPFIGPVAPTPGEHDAGSWQAPAPPGYPTTNAAQPGTDATAPSEPIVSPPPVAGPTPTAQPLGHMTSGGRAQPARAALMPYALPAIGRPGVTAPQAARSADPARPRTPEQRSRARKRAEPTDVADAGPLPGTGPLPALRHIVAASVGHPVFPISFALIIVLFLLVQHHLDRRDPKLAAAPLRDQPDLLFGPALVLAH